MATAVLGSDTNPGGRTYNEDRVEVQHLTSRAGQALAVAVLADGVGGEARGERAAQLALDTFLGHMHTAEAEDVLSLMMAAFKAANQVVVAEARKLGQEGRMATTMVAGVNMYSIFSARPVRYPPHGPMAVRAKEYAPPV